MANGFQGQEDQQVPEMTDAYCQSVADRYIELYQEITGTPFEPATDTDLAARIERNVNRWLKDNA